MSTDRCSSGRSIARFLSGLTLPVFALLLTGCGGGVGDITGKVTYKGNPVVHGSVGFVGADGIPRSTRINPDGTYTVKDVAVGEAKITVQSPKPVAQVAGAKGGHGGGRPGGREAVGLPKDAPNIEMPDRGEQPEYVDPEIVKKWVPIPDSVGDVAKTKLRFTVRKGANTHDIQVD
jgi:hypothetical protein